QTIPNRSRGGHSGQRGSTIIHIPPPQKPAGPRPQAGGHGAALEGAQASPDASRRSPYATVRDKAARAGAVEPAAVGPSGADALRTRRMNERAAAPRSFFEALGSVIRSDWLRRAFIVLLIAALIGLASSIYYHFAHQPLPTPFDSGGT